MLVWFVVGLLSANMIYACFHVFVPIDAVKYLNPTFFTFQDEFQQNIIPQVSYPTPLSPAPRPPAPFPPAPALLLPVPFLPVPSPLPFSPCPLPPAHFPCPPSPWPPAPFPLLPPACCPPEHNWNAFFAATIAFVSWAQ